MYPQATNAVSDHVFESVYNYYNLKKSNALKFHHCGRYLVKKSKIFSIKTS